MFFKIYRRCLEGLLVDEGIYERTAFTEGKTHGHVHSSHPHLWSANVVTNTSSEVRTRSLPASNGTKHFGSQINRPHKKLDASFQNANC